MSAERACVSREVGVFELRGRDASWVVLFLVHTNRAVHAVIDNHDNKWEVVLHSRRKLLAMHHEATIASKTNNQFVRCNTFCADGGGQAVTHRARGRSELCTKLRKAMKAM